MGLLKALFGSPKPPARPYVDEGLALTKRLIATLDLSGWNSGTPTFTDEESDAIGRELDSFQQSANSEAGKKGHQQRLLHSEAIGPMERTLGAEALRRFAGPGMGGSGWEVDDDCPADWKSRVSTYLKAWAMDLHPDALLELAPLLAVAGHRAEGKQAAGIVAAWFPSYAPRFFAGTQGPELVESITQNAREIMTLISNMEDRAVARMQSEYPTDAQIEEMCAALNSGNDQEVLRVLRKRTEERKPHKAEPTHEALLELVRQSSIRKLTDEELEILTSRLAWRDEAAEAQGQQQMEMGSGEAAAKRELRSIRRTTR